MTDTWNWNTSTGYGKKNCHTGNTSIFQHKNGTHLYIGGWNQGAVIDSNTHVIDLTGTEHRYHDLAIAYDNASQKFLPFINNSCAGWLSLPFPDYNVPAGLRTLEQWQGIANVILDIMKSGHDVLVACHGGHGRSGLFCSIVGYLLNIKKDRSWSSPVEKIRQIHCGEAVETYNQEKFVYDILGLNIQIQHSYIAATHGEDCPICGTHSNYIGDFGMCLNCKEVYSKTAPSRHDLTAGDIRNHEIKHQCGNKNCVGIWKADICGHVVHDMLIVDGLCEDCYAKAEEQALRGRKDKSLTEMEDDSEYGECCICGRLSLYGKKFGLCWDCAQDLQKQNNVDEVHNSITDPYRAVPHHCESASCIGVVKADTCGHVTHNKEVEDGLCEWCRSQKEGAK